MENKVFILDGGMGTMLQAAGLQPGEHPEKFGYEHPEIVCDIHKKYIAAGSDIIYTNTFGANSHKIAGSGIDTKTAVKAALQAARKAAEESQRKVKVALDVGPIGELLEPLGTLKFEDALEVYKEQMIAGEKYGADLIVIETFTDLYDAKAAVLAAKENTKLPVWVTMSYEESGRTFTGTKIGAMAMTLEGLGVDGIGINCSLGPNEILKLAKELREWIDVPMIIKPNAGLPDPKTGEYDLGAEDFGRQMVEFLKLGVHAMGGCCGTTPEYIQNLCKEVKEAGEVKVERPEHIRRGVCSATTMAEYGKVLVVGERLNPTGKKRFAQALVDHDFEYISRVALEEEDSGADVLDVNVGVPGADEVPLMVSVIKSLQGIVSLPLQIDSSDPAALEAGLRVYNGKAIINSVNADDERLALILPIAKKYGAAIIGLTLDEGGIPQTAQERVAHAEHILEKALEYGIKKEDVIIDCLTLTVSAQQDQAKETLKAMREVHERLGLHCTLGVSNISFGLPQRSHINESFLTQAMHCGLDLPIINPNISGMMDAVFAYRVLAGEDENSDAYIKRFSDQSAMAQKPESAQEKSEETIESAVLKGLKEEVKKLTKMHLETMSEVELINTKLIPALDVVGEQYEKQIIFLPQLINAANAASAGFDIIKERIAQSSDGNSNKGKIVVATVKGDVHDIGKNITKVILENYGYQVFDLGRDVPIELVAKTVEQEHVNLVGLSALMTTSLPSMKETILAVKKVNPNCKVWVGGAVLTEDYAMEMGADYYAKDARASVDIAKEVLDHA